MSQSQAMPSMPPADTEVLPDVVSAVAEVPGNYGAVAEAAWRDGFEPPEEYGAADDDGESFVPRPRYRIGRSTKVLACILLVALGAFGGALTQKIVDGGSARSSRSALYNGTGFGAGAGGGSAGSGTNQTSVNGTNGSGQNGTSGQGRRSRQSGLGTGGSGAGTGGSGAGG